MRHAAYLIFLFILCVVPCVSTARSEVTSLDDYLKNTATRSPVLKAIELEINSLRFEIAARDIELSPAFGVELTRFWDDRPSLSSNYKTEDESAVFTLSKPLATGTSFNLTSGLERAEYRTSPADDQHLLNWQLGVTQSLWQNSFGRQTSLRRKRDQSELQSRLLVLLLERQKTMIDFELLYWDIVYAQKEVDIRQENLERSRKIFEWVDDRFKRFAAERVDYLQAQALVATRELELQVARDNLKTLNARLREKLFADFTFTSDSAELQKERDVLSLPVKLDFAPLSPVLLTTLQSQAQADYLVGKSKLEADRLKPVLEVGYSYGQQGLSTSYSTARDDAFSTDNDYHQVGVTFSVPLDFSLIKKSRLATEYAAQAQQSRTEQLRSESQVSWEDLQRTIKEQKERVKTALSIAQLQIEKSREERSRYEKGKSTAFQAITFEQDAAESELLVVQLTAQLRRTEAQARNYTLK